MVRKIIGSLVCLAILFFMFSILGGGGHGHIQFRPDKGEDWIIFGGIALSVIGLLWIWFGSKIIKKK